MTRKEMTELQIKLETLNFNRMKELKEDIIEAVQDATDTVDGTVSIPILDHFLDGILNEQCNIADVRLSCFKEVFEKFQEIENESEFYGWLHAKAHEA